MKKMLELKKVISIVLICISIGIFQGCTSIPECVDKNIGSKLYELENNTKSEDGIRTLNYDEVKDSLIRFHVIANSDNEEDQNLKLKVKNKVIDYLYPYLNNSQSLDESRQIIKDRMQEVKKLAEEVIKDNNYEYDIQVELSRENFPDKSYGNITLPQGNYEAFRIIIGDGQGKNWWCVMFPPLCFVDESKAEVEYDKTENKINSRKNNSNLEMDLDSNENKYEGLDTQNDNSKNNNKNDVQIKFKIVEIINNLFN
ncbi:stage II sporulation protein R [Clostridium gelidum]|uniref:Stage II sporulation protein R n=1 Tax=Clostridium gelidum TaxID=704125 RepID=A0ABN6IS85_9CLOT|nr:stage II sporulation protein R [Clostridium gelidum]BCZ44486.1 stage II sporulation protein R [Clostridium gelidum]